MSADLERVEDGGVALELLKGQIYDAILLDNADDFAALAQKSLPVAQFRTRKDQTALHLSVSNSSFRVLDFLGTLSLPAAFVNQRNDCGETALHLVAATGDESLMRRFLALFGDKVDANVKDKWDRTASLLAVQNGYASLVELGLLSPLSPAEQARIAEEADRLKEQSSNLPAMSGLKATVQSDFLSQLRNKQATRRKSGQLTGDGDAGLALPANLDSSERFGLIENAASASAPSIMVKHLFARDATRETTAGVRLGADEGGSASGAKPVQIQSSAPSLQERSTKYTVTSQASSVRESQQATGDGVEGSNRRPAACDVTLSATIVTTSILSLNPSAPPSRPASAFVALSKLLEYPGNLALLQSVRLLPAADGAEGPVYDVNGRDFFGMTALHKACSWNKADIVAFLLQVPATDVNQRVPAAVKGTDRPVRLPPLRT